jgi:phosphoribosylglycinamide formyltransferase-1
LHRVLTSLEAKMYRVVILTADEDRHAYFRARMSNDARFSVIAAYCEGREQSLSNRVLANKESSELEIAHVKAREQAERDFFQEPTLLYGDKSNPIKIKRGDINRDNVVEEIVDLKPDLLVCYGSSLIKSKLLTVFKRRFINAHLGLSPYYRGSGTNVWPLIRNEPYMVGATFMHIDAGTDTGVIIHQIRADIVLGDSPHSIGNRMIRKMTEVYSDIVANFGKLTEEPQPNSGGSLYKMGDFDAEACSILYKNCREGMIEAYLRGGSPEELPYIVSNTGLLRAK